MSRRRVPSTAARRPCMMIEENRCSDATSFWRLEQQPGPHARDSIISFGADGVEVARSKRILCAHIGTGGGAGLPDRGIRQGGICRRARRPAKERSLPCGRRHHSYRHALQWHHGPGDDAARGTVSTRSAGQRPENEIRAPIRSEEALPSQARVQCRRKIHLRKQRSAGHSVGRLGGKRGGRSLYRSVQIQRAEDRAQRIAHSPNLRVSSIPITILRS
jgi:hypothetical protein